MTVPTITLRFSFVATLLLCSGLTLSHPRPLFAKEEGAAVAELYRQSYKLEAQGDVAAALGKMKEAKGKGGDALFLKMRTGWLAYLAGQWALADSSYRDAITQAPKAIDARLGLTASLLAQKKWKELVKECQQVLKLDENNAVARARLAHGLYSLGNYPDAASTYRTLGAQYPGELSYQTGLAWALVRMGRKEEARKIFDRVLTVSPDNASALDGVRGS